MTKLARESRFWLMASEHSTSCLVDRDTLTFTQWLLSATNATDMPEAAIENKAPVSGKKKIPTNQCGQASETFGYRGVYKVANYCSLFLGGLNQDMTVSCV